MTSELKQVQFRFSLPNEILVVVSLLYLFDNHVLNLLLLNRGELLKRVRGIVDWRFLWGMVAGLIIVKMELYILLMLPSACSPGAIFLRSDVWLIWTAEMRLLWICSLELDTLCCHFLSGILSSMPKSSISFGHLSLCVCLLPFSCFRCILPEWKLEHWLPDVYSLPSYGDLQLVV